MPAAARAEVAENDVVAVGAGAFLLRVVDAAGAIGLGHDRFESLGELQEVQAVLFDGDPELVVAWAPKGARVAPTRHGREGEIGMWGTPDSSYRD